MKIRRYYRGAAAVLEANVKRLSTPFKITFAVTYWCQYRCKTCNIWQRKPQDELSAEEIGRFVETTPSPSWMDLTGGEIFLRRDIGEILERIVWGWDRLLILHFPTNGFQTEQIVSTVSRLTTRSPARIVITVSVDGDEALNDHVRGMKGGFRRQMETLRALRRIRGVRAVAGMTLSGFNVGRFEETFRACQREIPGLKIDDFHVNVAQISDHYYSNAGEDGVTPIREGAIRELKLYRAMRGGPISVPSWLEHGYLKNLEEYLGTGRLPMRCHSLRSSCFIDPWGTVFPCITYTRPLGNLRETDMRLAPIWNAPDTRARQQEIWEGNCPQCWTACEAYQSMLGNLFRFDGAPTRAVALGTRAGA